MTIEMRNVYSDRVDQIGYDLSTKDLIVKWKRGSKTSVYKGVPPGVAEQTMNAPSIGQALREGIEGIYPHSYQQG